MMSENTFAKEEQALADLCENARERDTRAKCENNRERARIPVNMRER
jgi:hypothetical protein